MRPEETENSLYLAKPGEEPTLNIWGDNRFIRWTLERTDPLIANYFLKMNERYLKQRYTDPIISFGHLLPRKELMFPDKKNQTYYRFKSQFQFQPCSRLYWNRKKIRILGSKIHIHRHHHRNRNDSLKESIRYRIAWIILTNGKEV